MRIAAALVLLAACSAPPAPSGPKTTLVGITWLSAVDEHVVPLLKSHGIDVDEDPGACGADGIRVEPGDALRADALLREDSAANRWHYQPIAEFGRRCAEGSARRHLLEGGREWMERGEFGVARGWFDAACAALPDPECFAERAKSELRLGLRAEALESYRKARELAAADPYGPAAPRIEELEK